MSYQVSLFMPYLALMSVCVMHAHPCLPASCQTTAVGKVCNPTPAYVVLPKCYLFFYFLFFFLHYFIHMSAKIDVAFSW